MGIFVGFLVGTVGRRLGLAVVGLLVGRLVGGKKGSDGFCVGRNDMLGLAVVGFADFGALLGLAVG